MSDIGHKNGKLLLGDDLSAVRVAVIDVETTGLSACAGNRIIEIAIVNVSGDGSVRDEYHTMLNPRCDTGPNWVHGISNSMVENAPYFENVAGDLLAKLRDADFICGHNVTFDLEFLGAELSRVGVTLPPIASLCTFRMYRKKSLRLSCRLAGIPQPIAPHTALADAHASAALLKYLVERDPSILRTEKQSGISWPIVERRGTSCVVRH